MNKSIESLIQHDSGNMSSERQSSEDVQESTTAEDAALDGDGDYTDDNNFESNLRRRKGKIISCAKETIENASRQLRRKVPYAGHLMTPRRLWLNKIPTQCDVVIEFPEDAPDEALRWLLARIRSQPPAGLGLVVQVKAHESSRRNAFYISAPTNILFRAAEEARLPKRLRPDLGGALREFTTRESHCFQQIKSDDGNTALFTSQERQWLVLQVLQGLRAGQSDIEALQGRAALEEGQSIVAAWQETGLITQVFPLHETKSLASLQKSWVKQVLAPQPLDDIAEYFGVKVALYFAWLGHYTCALGVPAVFGTILYAFLWGKNQMAQDMGHVLFSLFNVAWASLYLEAWKRYSVELAFRWGTLSTPPELLEPPRPLYKGPLVENNVTGRLEPKEAPAWKRRAFRYLVSFPIIGLCLLLVFVVMFLMLRFQDWLDNNNFPDRGITQCMYNLHKDWWDSKLPESGVLCCLSVIPKVLLAGAITLMDEAYYKLAVWLNDKENYRLQSKYENHLIAKVALFQFVNSFLSLFYIAFYLRDEEKLKEQLAGLLISRQIIGNLRESAIPYVAEQVRLAKLSFNMWGALSPTQDNNRSFADTVMAAKAAAAAVSPTSLSSESEKTKQPSGTSTPQPGTPSKQLPKKSSTDTGCSTPTTTASATRRNIGQAEIESSLYKYDGTFSDHLEMLVQMGYVVLFSAAFPLAGICALINNLMEIRSDAFKLAHVHQRPFGQRVANIGTWQNALSLLSLAAVIVNCALIGLSGQVSRLWPGLTTAQTIILIVTLEHIMLGLRSALTWLLPELPSWLAAEIARAEHCRREMQCKGTSPRPTPPTPPSTTSTQPDHDLGALHLNDVNNSASHSNQQSIQRQLSEDLMYQQELLLKQREYEPYVDEIARFGLQRQAEPEANVFENRDSSPDSPPSQTSTILIRPLHESTPPNSGASLTSLNQELGRSHSGACKSCKTKKKIPEIPPFHGYSVRNLSSIPIQRLHALTGASASSLALNTRQCMNLPEIPPFRKKSTDSADHTGSSASSSPQRTTANSNLINASASVSASRQHLPLQSQPIVVAAANVNTATSASASSSNAHHQQQLQQQQSSLTSSSNEKKPLPTISKISDIPPFNARKISAESTMNLNITELKSHSDTMDVLKPAPSWTNVAMKTSTSQQQQAQHQQPPPQSSSLSAASPGASQQTQVIASSSSSSSGGASTTRAEFSRPSVGAISTTSTTSQQQQKDTQSSSTQQNDKEQASTSATQQAAKASTSGGNTTDEEAKAAELAAKKNRLKQKLVKSARSVAIFSLKLKERRQREAEKAATIAIEHAKALAKLPPLPQPGGELSLIPIEQLIQIEDIKPLLKPATSSSTSAASNSSSAATASNNTNNTMSTTTPSAALLAAAAAAHAHAQQSQQQQNNQPPGSSSSGGY
ncbi:platelet binding protein GspB isoform X3 [Stomoxys calcitrans]|uniref:platelet binding protein GspB isoform X3 n=1 Tax=Stomoxys calcitrans TaxID=35570 RepID=UPI0027E363E3|nr:platelet binding protein GspB isoform X3 [Stomoxys calcitrans]